MKPPMQVGCSHYLPRKTSTVHDLLEGLDYSSPGLPSIPRTYRQSSAGQSDMSDDSRRDSQGHQPETPRQGRFYHFPTSRPDQGYSTSQHPGQIPAAQAQYQQAPWPETQRPQMMNLPPPQPAPALSAFRRHHSLSLDSTSSRPAIPSFGETMMPPETSHQQASMSPSYSPNTSAQKRAFRQRRKDPSCDACRERKVKCDATDTMSCSECASRQVKCQFTKETNRRMSSMKQLQDLERQLAQAKHQNDRLRSIIRETGSAMDVDPSSTGISLLPSQRTHRQSERSSAYDQARRNVRTNSRGTFKPPAAHRIPRQLKHTADEVPTLPSKQAADQLILSCHNSFCLYSPVLHWPTFLEEYERTYKTGTLDQAPRSWIALLFAMFAIGTLPHQDQSPSPSDTSRTGSTYLHAALQQLQAWTDEPNIDHCRAALMVSTYYVETNNRSAGWTWLSVSVSWAVELGLNQHNGMWTPLEAETRRRLWWAIYNWERSLSLELSRSPLIRDDDTTTPMPENSGILPSQADSDLPAAFGQYNPSPLEIVMPVARLAEPLRKVTRNRPVSTATLAEYDTAFDSIASSMPEPLRPYATSYLDPNMLRISTSLANARLLLHRLNLAPSCSSEERAVALHKCVAAAESTARLVTRTLQPPPAAPQPFTDPSRSTLTWEWRARSSTSSLLCTHLWRCILFLSLSLNFTGALTCVRVSAAIGDLRQINTACGRYLVFFLERLSDRMRSGHLSRQALEQDEEMLAYASGDVQADIESAWIWGDGGTPLREEMPFFSSTGPVLPGGSPKRPESSGEVWPRVETLLMNLRHEQQRQRPLPEYSLHTRSGSQASIAGSEAAMSGSTPTPTTARYSPGGSERMKLSNIM